MLDTWDDKKKITDNILIHNSMLMIEELVLSHVLLLTASVELTGVVTMIHRVWVTLRHTVFWSLVPATPPPQHSVTRCDTRAVSELREAWRVPQRAGSSGPVTTSSCAGNQWGNTIIIKLTVSLSAPNHWSLLTRSTPSVPTHHTVTRLWWHMLWLHRFLLPPRVSVVKSEYWSWNNGGGNGNDF